MRGYIAALKVLAASGFGLSSSFEKRLCDRRCEAEGGHPHKCLCFFTGSITTNTEGTCHFEKRKQTVETPLSFNLQLNAYLLTRRMIAMQIEQRSHLSRRHIYCIEGWPHTIFNIAPTITVLPFFHSSAICLRLLCSFSISRHKH